MSICFTFPLLCFDARLAKFPCDVAANRPRGFQLTKFDASASVRLAGARQSPVDAVVDETGHDGRAIIKIGGHDVLNEHAA
jgi:hypothetical protein